MTKKFCLTCERELRPDTHVPRQSKRHEENEMARRYREEQIQKRQEELDNGDLGFMAEGQFCNGTCATFYGRVAARFATQNFEGAFFDDPQVMFRRYMRKVLDLYTWVQKRKANTKLSAASTKVLNAQK